MKLWLQYFFKHRKIIRKICPQNSKILISLVWSGFKVLSVYNFINDFYNNTKFCILFLFLELSNIYVANCCGSSKLEDI